VRLADIQSRQALACIYAATGYLHYSDAAVTAGSAWVVMTASDLCPRSPVDSDVTIPSSLSMPGSIPRKEPTIFSSERVGARRSTLLKLIICFRQAQRECRPL
jgi:hypothetical protein